VFDLPELVSLRQQRETDVQQAKLVYVDVNRIRYPINAHTHTHIHSCSAPVLYKHVVISRSTRCNFLRPCHSQIEQNKLPNQLFESKTAIRVIILALPNQFPYDQLLN
jgi:hypothetical protein